MDFLFYLKLCGFAAMGLVSAVAMRRELAACLELGLAWPGWLTFPAGEIDLFGSPSLVTNAWRHLMSVDVMGAQSNVVVTVPCAAGATNSPVGFFCAADLSDSDGDGLTDAEERLVHRGFGCQTLVIRFG